MSYEPRPDMLYKNLSAAVLAGFLAMGCSAPRQLKEYVPEAAVPASEPNALGRINKLLSKGNSDREIALADDYGVKLERIEQGSKNWYTALESIPWTMLQKVLIDEKGCLYLKSKYGLHTTVCLDAEEARELGGLLIQMSTQESDRRRCN